MKAMAREHYGLEMNEGPFGIDSRPALILDKYAESQGKGAQFHEEVFRAYWQEAKSIEDESVLKEMMTRVGLGLLCLLLVVVTYNDLIKFKIAEKVFPMLGGH